jgi:hypothetical protein
MAWAGEMSCEVMNPERRFDALHPNEPIASGFRPCIAVRDPNMSSEVTHAARSGVKFAGMPSE